MPSQATCARRLLETFHAAEGNSQCTLPESKAETFRDKDVKHKENAQGRRYLILNTYPPLLLFLFQNNNDVSLVERQFILIVRLTVVQRFTSTQPTQRKLSLKVETTGKFEADRLLIGASLRLSGKKELYLATRCHRRSSTTVPSTRSLTTCRLHRVQAVHARP